ncbi:hypothetical protein [Streptomyces sp. NPDC001787]|uniref:hypothetical protein n=1 Tax=Streptomyces sp. NPDC001787 TaxID=3154523 RepID=UPI003330CB55
MTITLTRPTNSGGGYGSWEDDDNQRGPERDETDTDFHQLVHRLVLDGDHRARTAGRHARRTLAEMAPGYERQPILRLTRPLVFRSSDEMRAADEPCLFCGRWLCPGCSGTAPAPATAHTHAA